MRWNVVFALSLCLLTPTSGMSQPEPLKLGMSAAFTGPASALGNGMRVGIQAALDQFNQAGGVHGREVSLVALDDGYEPARTAPNMRGLIDKHGVFAILGNVGTPTAAVAVPIANEKKVPFWGAFTGAGLLRKTPPDRYIFNYRASYAQETAQIIEGAITELGISPERIGFFTQNDAYGDAGYNGAIKALTSRGYKRARRLVHARYTRNTLDVEYGVSQLIDPRHELDLVIMVGTADPCAKMIRLARKHGLRTTFVAVSFIGAGALLTRLGPELSEGLVVSQVVPHPEKSELPAAVAFRNALPQAAKRSFVSFEGYLAAQSLLDAIQRAPKTATREQLVDHIETSGSWRLGLGVEHTLTKTEHQISHNLWPTIIRNGEIVPLQSWRDVRRRGER